MKKFTLTFLLILSINGLANAAPINCGEKNDANSCQRTSGACEWKDDKCTPKQFEIIYQPNNGTPGEEQKETVTYGANFTTKPSDTYTRTGYTFDGWGDARLEANQQYTYESTDNMYLPAQWAANKFKIEYNGNGATNTPTHSPTECTYDRECTAPQNRFTLTGSNFSGWKCTGGGESCNGNIIAAGDSLKNATATNGATITLTAQWGTNTFKVNYSGGTGATGTPPSSPTTCTYGGDCKAPTNTYSKTGYTFANWKCTSGCTSEQTFNAGDSISTATNTNNGEITLTAQWTANTFTIKFSENKPSNASNNVTGSMSELECTYDANCTLTNNNFSLNGWNFKDWNTESDGSGAQYRDRTSVRNITDKNNDTITLYAQWTAKTSTINYDCGEGQKNNNFFTNPSAYTATATYDSSFTFADSDICSHWTKNFGGWKGNYNGEEKTFNAKHTLLKWQDDSSSITFTAQWSNRNYKCDAGKYLKADTEQCTDCPAGYYCPGFSSTAYTGSDIGINPCPLGMTSDARATKKELCYISATTKFTDNNGANFTISKFGTATKYYYGSSTLPWHNTQP